MGEQDLFVLQGQKEAFKLLIDEIPHDLECLFNAQ